MRICLCRREMTGAKANKCLKGCLKICVSGKMLKRRFDLCIIFLGWRWKTLGQPVICR